MPTLFDCHRSRVPVLAIVAHIPSPEKNPSFTRRSRNAATIANWCPTGAVAAPRNAIREAVG